MFDFIDTIREDPWAFFESALYSIPAVLIALILHEWAHGYVAYRLGDPTAKNMGRLSLNPFKHLDPIGTLSMLFLRIGWAKPVPVNPENFKHPHRDDLLVSIAGITMNLLLFLLFTLVLIILNYFLWDPLVLEYYSLHDLIGYKSILLNVILNGSADMLTSSNMIARPGLIWVVRLTGLTALVNLNIAIFNLFPIPPLDGSHVVNDLLFKGKLFASPKVAGIGTAIMLVLVFTGVLSEVIGFLANGLQSGLLTVIEAVMGNG